MYMQAYLFLSALSYKSGFLVIRVIQPIQRIKDKNDIQMTGFIQARISKLQGLLQGLLKASQTVFKDVKLMKILI